MQLWLAHVSVHCPCQADTRGRHYLWRWAATRPGQEWGWWRAESFMPQGLQHCWGGKGSEPYKIEKNCTQKIAWTKNFCIDEDRSVPNHSVPCCEKWLCSHHEKLKLIYSLFCFAFLLNTTGDQGALLPPKTFLLAGETPYSHEGDWCGISPHKVYLKGFFNKSVVSKVTLGKESSKLCPEKGEVGAEQPRLDTAQCGEHWAAAAGCTYGTHSGLPGDRKYFWWECEAD